MDNLIKTVDTLRVCRECVKRQGGGNCQHNCDDCDLSLPNEVVLKALNTAIALLDAQRNMKDVIEGRIY